MTKSLLVAGLALAMSGAAYAQEEPPVEADDQATEEARPQARKKIRVLEDPYDLASFYRSRQTRGGVFGYEDGDALGRVSDDPYAIAGYYRNRQRAGAYGYSQFWTNGYGGPRARRYYGRRIGRNGDLFLLAPTILAPVGPLTTIFEIDR